MRGQTMFKFTTQQAGLLLVLSSPAILQAAQLNDTGIGQSKYSSEQTDYFFRPQDVRDYPGQDPQYGRDAAVGNLNKTGSGHAGFDFSTDNNCVVDNVTGLIWERKTDASGDDMHSNKWTFTWRDDSALPLVAPKVAEAVVIPEQPAPAPEVVMEEIPVDAKILFHFDKSYLTPQAIDSINNSIDSLGETVNDVRNITVVGHTDWDGSDEYNQGLSERRAKSTATYLKTVDSIAGVNIDSEGRGELEPIDTNETREGRANNRRVMLNLQVERIIAGDTLAADGAYSGVAVASAESETPAIVTNNENPLLPESAVPAICRYGEQLSYCDTQTYIMKANEQELCGYTDWRLPTREELRSIVDYGFSMPSIDKAFFPNTISHAYWTSSRYVANDFRVWVVDYEHGGDNTHEKHRTLPIRLVRGDSNQPPQNTNQDMMSHEENQDGFFSNLFKPVTDLF